MSLKPIHISLIGLVCVVVCFQFVPADKAEEFHSQQERMYYTMLQDSLPVQYNGLFAGSGACVNCHGYDEDGMASTTSGGQDVNVVDDWRASIMGNSGKDPYWIAKVRESVLSNPEHQAELEDKCTSCHAPMGRYTAALIHEELYSMEDFAMDSLGQDGVSCLACHQQSPIGQGETFSGELNFETEQIAYGPFTSPLISPMSLATGYIPEYSEHISKSELCAGCHTLVTDAVDLDGILTGTTFVEQATYHEWLNSDYTEDGLDISCQDCHMPSLGGKEPIMLAAGFETPPRAPFSLHSFRGVNTHMLNIMKDNMEELNIAASEEDFDESIAATAQFLQFQSLVLDVEYENRTADTVFAVANLTNLAGHKFPSGYPARRLFLNIEMTDEDGNILFSSGTWDDDYYLNNEDSGFEPHHDVIRNEGDVQIYEMVMGDVNGDFTSILERGYSKLKDNRLVPRGFSTSHSTYADTTYITGAAALDSNFNLDEGEEGTGGDQLHLHLPTLGYAEPVLVTVTAYYQAIPPKFLDELFAFDDPEIEAWQNLYDASDKTPFQVRQASVEVLGFVGINEANASSEELLPWYNHFTNELVFNIETQGIISIYNLSGKLVHTSTVEVGQKSLDLDLAEGMYVLGIDNQGTLLSRRFVVMK